MTYWGEPSSYLWMRMGRERGLPFLSISSDSSSRLMETNLMTSFHIFNLCNILVTIQTLVHWKMDFTDSNVSQITTYLSSGRQGSKHGKHLAILLQSMLRSMTYSTPQDGSFRRGIQRITTSGRKLLI